MKKWVRFEPGAILPPERRDVLVQLAGSDEFSAPAVAVGYLRYAAGDRFSPTFVVPGVGHLGGVVAYCDCLGDDYEAPLSKAKQPVGVRRRRYLLDPSTPQGR